MQPTGGASRALSRTHAAEVTGPGSRVDIRKMSNPHPGTVRSDRQAFAQIATRFRSEAGQIQARVNVVRGPVPLWALIRTMFPVAESEGDLIYRRGGATADNLRSVLANEFEQVRRGYAGKAALWAHLYRHSLTHHDEVRTLASCGREVGWKVSSANDSQHLEVRHLQSGLYRIEFQPRAFYEDTLRVCESAEQRKWGGAVAGIYNSWMTVDLDSVKSNGSVKLAKAELAARCRTPSPRLPADGGPRHHGLQPW